jgi:uncharacterized protein (TIGR02598 family)
MHRWSSYIPATERPSFVTPRRNKGFSLVEISLALGIIAFAFIALLGLLPVGLQTFRSAIDTGNETRIVQSFFTMLMATDYEKIRGLDYNTSKEIFYFDEEGMPTDTSVSAIPALSNQRLYAAKLFIEDPEVPTKGGSLTYGVNAVVFFSNIATPGMRDFEAINSLGELQARLKEKQGVSDLTVRPLLVAKMDGTKQQ